MYLKTTVNLATVTLKMNLNDLESLWSLSQNDLHNVYVKCTKFEVSIFISFKIIEKNSVTE